MRSIGAKINYVLLLVFLICGVGMLIVNAKINSMDDITNEISQNYIASVSEVDAISENVTGLKSQTVSYTHLTLPTIYSWQYNQDTGSDSYFIPES